MQEMVEAGAAAFSDDGDSVADTQLMASAMRIAAELDIVVMDHALDRHAAGSGVMRHGKVADGLGLPGIRPEAESAVVKRDMELAEQTGCTTHIQHISSFQSVEHIRAARAAGLKVSGELTPHHLALTHDNITSADPNMKMNPPLGTVEDREALIAAVIDGTLRAFATDHAPHTASAKSKGFLDAPFGVVGLETAVGITYTQLVATGLMPALDWLRRWTTGPAHILGRPSPGLVPGQPGDITILDTDSEWIVDSSAFLSRSSNSPFDGMALRGHAVHTLLGGVRTWQAER